MRDQKAMVRISALSVGEAIELLFKSVKPLSDFIDLAVNEGRVDGQNVIVPMMALEWLTDNKQAAAQALSVSIAVLQLLRARMAEDEKKAKGEAGGSQ